MTTNLPASVPGAIPSEVEISDSIDCKAGDITSEIAIQPWLYAALQVHLKRNPRQGISEVINTALELFLEPESPFSDIEAFASDREVA